MNHPTRRKFLITTGTVSAGSLLSDLAPLVQAQSARPASREPWYANCYRWGQTNLSKKDMATIDVGWWRDYWKATEIQAVLLFGVASYAPFPSRNPLIESSPFAPNRDVFGELNAAARADGIHVLVRMDLGIVTERVGQAFADYRTVGANGQRGGMCLNSPYRERHAFELFREIIERYQVVGFTDNSGVAGNLCYCDYCKARWAKDVGGELPRTTSLDDPLYRRWRRWNADVVLGVWDEANRFVKEIGGPDCLYLSYIRKTGTNSRDIAARVPFTMMDCQSRNDAFSFSEHADEARYIRSLTNWQKNAAVITATYHHSHGYFRATSDPVVEARMYTKAGMAGGFHPWWHSITARPPDNRAHTIPVPVHQWHKKNEQYLVKGKPVAAAGIVRSEDSAIFYGAGAANVNVQMPYRGMLRAIFPSRIPYYPLHIKDLAVHSRDLRVLVYPNVGGMSDAECAEAREYVRNGGSILATGVTSLYDQDGVARQDFGLADVFGVSVAGRLPQREVFNQSSPETFLALGEGARHPALAGLGPTATVAFGGRAIPMTVASGRQVLARYATLAESGAIVPDAGSPSIVVGEFGQGRVAYLPADLDRQYLREPNPDHAAILGGLLRWLARDTVPFTVEGDGYIGAYLNQQDRRLVLHLFNGTGVDNGDDITDRFYPVGRLRIRVQAPESFKNSVRLLAAERTIVATRRGAFLEFDVQEVGDYEVAVLE